MCETESWGQGKHVCSIAHLPPGMCEHARGNWLQWLEGISGFLADEGSDQFVALWVETHERVLRTFSDEVDSREPMCYRAQTSVSVFVCRCAGVR